MKKFFIAMAVFLTVCINVTGCYDSDNEDRFSHDNEVITAEVKSETISDTTEISTIVTNETTSKDYLTSADITEVATSTIATVFTSEITTFPDLATPIETAATPSITVAVNITAAATITTTTTTPVPDSSYSIVVYVAASGKGKKYHNNPDCSNMKGNVTSISIENAVARGYTPCKKCYG